ncbi:bifunctional hydroxymethylpyrimidine kinase/phosphomethylpyrimidine kinase [Carboxydochorda subterranea]|uniref:Multifunctional fusion protein n=1 Tax=Carboxydichorda subterranea TaxID=3109565 RepID=A0ABZ1C1K8_9FIRM|nr:bifunctional hydroxymethylpyrimidine kinase/phosphomethylpyrimidine kinase [Limnochorda sp. L945t]WRP18768.1 bifunctional hydroxymethylpyrimidine kinase/phosphomethylpyrimidine kinase [Limnochorda sp. L945t]
MGYPRALTIAGSDSGGGAGIQADIKTFQMLGTYGTSVVTALTAQDTTGVHEVVELSPAFVMRQLEAVLSDIGADAAKTGMLASSAIIEAVARTLETRPELPLVVDPVMVAKSGDSLLDPGAVEALRTRLLPRATVVTPNVPEAQVLTGLAVRDVAGMQEAARQLVAMGARWALVKGGHLDTGDEVVDVLFDGRHFELLRHPRIRTVHTHGTGCTLSAAITAFIARGFHVDQAVRRAQRYMQSALEQARELGHGRGPTNHWAGADLEAIRRLGSTSGGVVPVPEPAPTPQPPPETWPIGARPWLWRAAPFVQRIRAERPTIHAITNLVTIQRVASAALAVGAAPIMADAPQEAETLAAASRGLVLNIGTPDDLHLEAMLRAAQAASRAGIPIVLDPVGVGATTLRQQLVLRLITTARPSAIKANLAEGMALWELLRARETGQPAVEVRQAGVEPALLGGAPRPSLEQIRDVAACLARRLECLVAITGPVDVVSDGARTLEVHHGHPLMGDITGSGCMVTAVVAAFLAVARPYERLDAAAAALAVFAIAGQRAAGAVAGPGTLPAVLLDELDALTRQPARAFDPRLYVITDSRRTGVAGVVPAVEAALRGGSRVVQLREKTLPTPALLELGHALRDVTRQYGAVFLVNDRIDVAKAVQADGVHLGTGDMPVERARAILGPESIIGASVESAAEAAAAARAGADYLGVGPVYATMSKEDAGAARGIELVRQVRKATHLPIVAISGIDESNAPPAIEAGADGVAVIAAVMGAPDPEAAARRLLAAVERGLARRGLDGHRGGDAS